VLAGEFGVPVGGSKPKARIVAGGRLPLMWLLYSRAVRILCGQGLADGLVRS
jgi:hypothetical protein